MDLKRLIRYEGTKGTKECWDILEMINSIPIKILKRLLNYWLWTLSTER